MLDLTSLSIFLMVVEKGSFSAAAEQLNRSPSSISKHIGGLEKDLGVKLINRSTHHLFPTEAGRRLVESARRVINEVDSTIQGLHEVSDDFAGVIRIHLTPGSGRAVALPVICDFMRRHRSLRVELTISPAAVHVLHDGYDLSIRSGDAEDEGLLHQSSVECLRLTSAHYRICASRGYLREAGRPRHPRDLTRHKCLIYGAQPSPREWWFRDETDRFSVAVNGSLVANEWSVIRDAVTAGLGIARVLTIASAKRPPKDPLVELFPDLIDASRAVWAIFPRMRPMPKKVAALLSHLQASV